VWLNKEFPPKNQVSKMPFSEAPFFKSTPLQSAAKPFGSYSAAGTPVQPAVPLWMKEQPHNTKTLIEIIGLRSLILLNDSESLEGSKNRLFKKAPLSIPFHPCNPVPPNQIS